MMKKHIKKCLFFISAFSVFSVYPAQNKPWTFLVYMAAANDLNSCALLDLQEMMQAGSNSNVNIIVYLTLQEDGQSKETKKLYVEKGFLTQIGPTMVRDSGDVATLMEALQWAYSDYPSDNIAVVLWDHGPGPSDKFRYRRSFKGVCYDFDTGNYLTDRDCLQAFSWGCDILRGGKKYDIIACDACLLASVEMAYTFSSCADYFVAPEGVIPGDSYRYAHILNQCGMQLYDSFSFAKCMVGTSNDEYYGMSDYTLSVMDLNALQPLIDNVNAVAQVLSSHLKGKNYTVVKTAIKKAVNINNCPSFDNGIYIDMLQFYKNLLKHSAALQLSKTIAQQFQQVLVSGIAILSTLIKANVTSASFKNAGGLSIYFSRYSIDPSYYGLYWTEKNPNWLNFLEAFLG